MLDGGADRGVFDSLGGSAEARKRGAWGEVFGRDVGGYSFVGKGASLGEERVKMVQRSLF